jgi:hypothetical protein
MATRRYGDVARAGAAARRRLDQGVEVLGRLVPIALRVSRIVGIYVVLVGLAASTIVVTLLVRFWPG